MSDSGVFTSEDPLSVLQKETEEIELLLATLQPTSGPKHTEETLLPSTSRPAPFPTSDTRNQTEATALLPSTSRPAPFPTSDTRNQTEETALLPATSRPAPFPTSDTRNQTEATALLPSTSRPAPFPTSDTRNQTEATALLPSTSRPAPFPTSDTRNQTEATALLPSTSRPAPFPTSDTRNQTEETALLPATSRPAPFPTSDTRNQTEATALLPSTSRPAPFPTSDTRNQTEATALLPSTSRSSLSPIRTRNHGVSPAASDEEVVSGADEDLAGPSSIRIEDRALREAIRALDVASVKSLLARDAPLTHVADGTTPLHLCMDTYWGGKLDVSPDPECLAHLARRAEAAGGTLDISQEIQDRLRRNEINRFVIIEAMVEAAKNSGVLECPNEEGETALYVAIKSFNLYAIGVLLRARANITNLNREGETSLHVAVRHYPEILDYFLSLHDIIIPPNSVNKCGNAPMHYAVISGNVESVKLLLEKFQSEQMNLRNDNGETPWHKIAGGNYMATAQYLFQTTYKWDLNVVDNGGRTPLQRVASQGYVPMTTLLLRNGATLSVKGEKESAIKCISSKFNNPLNFFEDLFDECVSETESYMSVNYEVLVGKDMSQIKVLEDLVRYGQRKILKHPTIESLIYFKWRCLLPVFYTIIVTYVTFLLSLNTFVITTFYNIDTSNVTKVQFNATEALFNATEMPFNATEVLFNATKMPFDATEEIFNATEVHFNATETPCVEGCGWRHWTLVVFIYISTGVLITLECIWIYLQKLHHFGRPETWLKLIVIILALAVPVFLGCSPAPDSMTWQRHVACVAVLLAWLQAMLLLSRFHGWGYYVLMLERVAYNIGKILATTIFLVFGFSTCLMIQYQSKPPFDGPGAAFTKTLVMMASEFDYEDLFGEEHDAELKNTKKFVRFLFVVFVVFVAIVLMNFMIGVAVSDVEELNDIGNIRRLEKQVQLLSTLEGLGDTWLAKWWRRLLLIRFHSHVDRYLTSPVRVWFCSDLRDTTLPWYLSYKNDVRETFSSELHNAILNIAKKKKQNSSPPITTNERMKSLEDKMDSIIESMANSERIKSLEDKMDRILESMANSERINSLEDKMDRILESMASNVNTKDRAKVVSHKLSQKMKNIRKKSNRLLAE